LELICMLLLTLALGVVIWFLITHQPKPRPAGQLTQEQQAKLTRQTAKRTQRRYWLIAAMAVVFGITLTLSPLVGPLVSGGTGKLADLVTTQTPSPSELANRARQLDPRANNHQPKAKPQPKRGSGQANTP
jgi:ABC-type Fe3+ transport system permease subunit